jgi:hypothetical protein
MVADAIVETHDRIVGKLYRTCERRREEHLRERRGAIGDTLKSFSRVGALVSVRLSFPPVTTKRVWRLRSRRAAAGRRSRSWSNRLRL